MDAYKEFITLGYAELDTLGELDYLPYAAVDVTRVCFSELDYDPWDLLRAIRAEMTNTPLALTLAGQCLVSDRILSDDIVEAFVIKAVENGISEFRIYDPLNDPRNLQTAITAAKRCGAKVYAGMVYSKNSAYSPAFFAGYAAQLSALGADGIWLFSMSAIIPTRTACLPPSNSAPRKESRMSVARQEPVTLAPMQSTFASLCCLVIFAE
jgi:pyruvate/oxaloacetate carboxyltransferase